MPYKNREELPESVLSALRDVPHAQTIYMEAYNGAYDQYAAPEDRKEDRSREETAHAVAWAAVKEKYRKGKDGKWHPTE